MSGLGVPGSLSWSVSGWLLRTLEIPTNGKRVRLLRANALHVAPLAQHPNVYESLLKMETNKTNASPFEIRSQLRRNSMRKRLRFVSFPVLFSLQVFVYPSCSLLDSVIFTPGGNFACCRKPGDVQDPLFNFCLNNLRENSHFTIRKHFFPGNPHPEPLVVLSRRNFVH